MFCPNCGNKNDDSSAFCAWCGTPLKNFAPPTPPVQQPAQPVQQPVQAQEPVYPAPVQPEQAPVYPEPAPVQPEPTPVPVQPEAEQPEPVEELNNCEDMRCSNCGTQMPGDERICPNCGHICISEVDEEEVESSSKGKIIGIILVVLVLIAGVGFLGHKMEWWEIPFLSSSSEKSTEEGPEELDFENISGTSDSFKYDIAWPVAGDEDLVTELRSWIVKQVLGTSYSEDQDFPELMSSYKQEYLNSCDSDATRTINVKYEKDAPFEDYITLSYYDEEVSGMPMPVVNGKADELYIRLSDNKILYSEDLDAKKAITDDSKIKRLVKKYGDGIDYNASALPVDKMPLHLTKEGLEVGYAEGYAMRSTFIQTCTIPYAEAIPALSEEVKSFLPENLVAEADAAAQADAAAMEGLTEDLMRSLITKANTKDPSVMSSELKALVNKYKSLYGQYYNDFGVIFQYGPDPENIWVYNPDIKIMEYYPENDKKVVRVIFDVRNSNNPADGWFSQMTWEKCRAYPQLFAADFVKENGNWVIDDIFTQSGDRPIEIVDISNASSFKEGVQSSIEMFSSYDWDHMDEWDV